MTWFDSPRGRAKVHGLPRQSWAYPAAAGIFALMFSMPSLGQASSPAVSCESLAKQTLPNTAITTAQMVAPGDLKMPSRSIGGPPPGGTGGPAGQQAAPFGRRPRTDLTKLPAICRVQAAVRPSRENEATLEVWLPATGWNGSLMTMTHPSSASGSVPADVVEGVRRGYAALLNTGPALDAWDIAAKSPDLLLDFGYRTGHAMLVAARAITNAFYGSPVNHAYFLGCSEGGREGFNAAHHYPEDYDGIIVGGSGIQFSIINAAQMYPAWFMSKDRARFIPEPKWTMIHNAVLDACDMIDGIKDRVIADPRQCPFNPDTLLCKGAEADNCLTAPQVEALKATYKGPVNPRTGEVIFPGPVLGGELPVFEFANPDVPMRPAALLYKALVFGDPDWDFRTLDFDKDVQLAIQKVAPAIETAPADLRAYFDRGGRLLYWDGWNDFNNPYYWMDYHAGLQKLLGAEKVAKSFQMYFVPGMQHCSGGEGCDSFDKLGAITEWVTTGRPPARILSSHIENGIVTNTRPICPYPQVAKYKGLGDPNNDANYVCTDTRPGYK
jgi:feruloyl esterase